MPVLRWSAFCLLLIAALPLQAAPPDALPDGGSGVVGIVIDGDTLRLKGSDQDVRLVGIQAPKLPLGRKGFKAWPMADEARGALVNLIGNQSVTLRLGESPQDRHGRTLAHVVRKDGVWIQGEMLRLGFARVYTFPDNRKLATEMLALEAEARAANRGIWANEFYSPRDAQDVRLAELAGTYQVVRGDVRTVAAVRDRTYINFGDDFRADFTVSIERTELKRFESLDLKSLVGRTVEVRGWLVRRNGAMIEATHPEQIVIMQ